VSARATVGETCGKGDVVGARGPLESRRGSFGEVRELFLVGNNLRGRQSGRCVGWDIFGSDRACGADTVSHVC
jgi:hypothetical protein